MFLNSSKFLFLVFMTVGVIISLTCNSWIMIWSGMELFLLSFIPYFCNFSFVSSESSMKYFLVQGMSSSLFIFNVFFLLLENYYFFSFFLCFSLLLKLGCAPLHSWVVGVVSGMSYDSLFIFFCFSKLPPFFLLSYLCMGFNFFVLMSLVFGSVGGLGYSSMKKLMGFSSIFNLGFLIYLINVGSLWSFYFLVYTFMIFFIFMFLLNYELNYLNQFYSGTMSLSSKISFWILFLSLGGMPPMIGFFIKLISIEYSILNNDYFITSFMIFFSLVVMFFYIRISYVSMIFFSFLVKWHVLINLVQLNLLCLLSLFVFPFFLVVKV
uniref:NADH-ubiquinone oxidoreductase chain 2 n=1 Tax=Dusuna sp. TaxID=3133678 RepID=A0AAU6PCJ7_9HEMI